MWQRILVENKTCSLHHNFIDEKMVPLNRISVLGSFRKSPRVTVCNGEESSRLVDVLLGESRFYCLFGWLVLVFCFCFFPDVCLTASSLSWISVEGHSRVLASWFLHDIVHNTAADSVRVLGASEAHLWVSLRGCLHRGLTWVEKQLPWTLVTTATWHIDLQWASRLTWREQGYFLNSKN